MRGERSGKPIIKGTVIVVVAAAAKAAVSNAQASKISTKIITYIYERIFDE